MKIIATCSSYEERVDAYRSRLVELGLTCEQVDALSGLQSGYTGKLLGPAMVKKFGPTSEPLMNETLAVKWVMVEDTEALNRMERRYEERERPPANNAHRISMALLERVKPAFFRQFSNLATLGRQKIPAATRRRIARHAARARWRKSKRRAS